MFLTEGGLPVNVDQEFQTPAEVAERHFYSQDNNHNLMIMFSEHHPKVMFSTIEKSVRSYPISSM